MTARREDGTLRVLIIDTDNVRRGMLACTLPASAFSLEFAKSAEKGLDLLGHLQPEIVIVGRDASVSDVCQRIRSLPAGMSCTLVLMDELYRDPHVGESEAEAAGADAFLPFPFEAQLFDERIRARLERQTTPPAPVASPRTSATSPAAPSPPPASKPGTDEREAAWSAFRGRVGAFHGNLGELDYYQLLQVGSGAGPGEIKDAYFKCSMEYHPDRFMQLSDEELREQIYEVYKRMSEAFKVLINPELRSQYDLGLASDRAGSLRYLDRGRQIAGYEDPTSDAATSAGKRYLHFANLAAVEGNLRSARMYLTLAVQCEPQNAALRARLDAVTRKLEP